MSLTNLKIKIAVWVAWIFICLNSSLASDHCDAYVDKVLSQMKAEKEFFHEPYEIPDGEKSFAIYELDFGNVYGLSTLHRIDHVIPLKRGKSGNPYIKVFLGAGEIRMQSSIKRKFFNLGKSANLDADVPFITMELEVVPNPDGTEPAIENFKVDEVKGLKIKVSGSGIIKDFVLNAFLKVFGRFFQKTVKSSVEERLTKFLRDKVKDLTIPEECLKEAWD